MTQTEPFDMLVIGGGINGAGVARDAAGRGLSVALCEQGDFAGATSSASTKLIHGGLRYLEQYEFRLVSEALHEREHLLRIAPHIARPLRFVMPHVPALRPRWMIQLGMWLYDRLGGRISLPSSIPVRLDRFTTPSGLKQELQHGFAYSDAWVDDARLVILNLRSAQDKGAVIHARTRLLSAVRSNGLWACTLKNTLTGTTTTAHARTLVNTAGPWVATLDNAINGRTTAGVKLVRGSHIVVPRLFAGEHAYILQQQDKRIVFMIPYEDQFTLIGTTDVAQDNMDNGAHISDAEKTYLLDAVNQYLAKPVSQDDIVWTYSGVRPLFDDEADNPSAVTRDYTLVLQDQEQLPCVSVYGGKITTYRKLAESVMHKLRPWLDKRSQRGSWTATEALPGGDFTRDNRQQEVVRLQQAFARLDPHYLIRLFARHGQTAHEILKGIRFPDALGEDFGAGLTQHEVDYLIRHEWAVTAEDILWRRTKCGLHMTAAQRQRLHEYLAAR